ncbi:hypothetical protein A4X03_0g8845, partial [Tilletia caries]
MRRSVARCVLPAITIESTGSDIAPPSTLPTVRLGRSRRVVRASETGNLEPAHQRSLREMWRRFHELSERNVEVSERLEKTGGPTSEGFAAMDENKAKKGPKGDAAMDDAKKAEELKEMNQFLDKYGGPYLRRAFWEFTKLDHPDTTMLRFLRARKWDVDRALAMLAA